MKKNKRKRQINNNPVGSCKSHGSEPENNIGFDVEANSFELDEDNEDSFELE
jgi:hypothetical protein